MLILQGFGSPQAIILQGMGAAGTPSWAVALQDAGDVAALIGVPTRGAAIGMVGAADTIDVRAFGIGMTVGRLALTDNGDITSITWGGIIAGAVAATDSADFAGLGTYGTTTNQLPYQCYTNTVNITARWAKTKVVSTGCLVVTDLGGVHVTTTERSESGTVTTSSSGPATVTLRGTYQKAVGIQLTLSGSATPCVVAYDNVVVGSGTNTFDVYAFDRATGLKQSVGVAFTFVGI
jgi:hypothetical protein